ncbi:hypothetical protein LAV73_09060 [Lysinibacillus xylanilyticus]|uniref:hypothetical protein n=1 Tax=Lysinibacillus xylanilyticus TaxID=582475 RepID=UPI002B2416EA|nr:hypothetical protein [Lysinibacillus xylanilyticus]MEB2280144.1 hypothetical protein [Lysinibacillus xylanilyticus]
MTNVIGEITIHDEKEKTSDSELDYIQMWKITEFTEVMNETFKQKYDEELNITVNTLNNYFRDLESSEIHYLNRLNGTKIYDPMDLDIAIFIACKRSKKQQKGITWQLPQIFEAIKRDLPCRPKPVDADKNPEKDNIDITKQLEEFKHTVMHEIGLKFDIQQQLLEMKQDNEKQVNRSMLEIMQKQNEFKSLARIEWDKKSSSEKYEGFIFKREKIKEREQFIDDFVDKKLMEWILEQTKG